MTRVCPRTILPLKFLSSKLRLSDLSTTLIVEKKEALIKHRTGAILPSAAGAGLGRLARCAANGANGGAYGSHHSSKTGGNSLHH